MSAEESAAFGYVVLDEEKFLAEVERRVESIERERPLEVDPLTKGDWIFTIVAAVVVPLIILVVFTRI